MDTMAVITSRVELRSPNEKMDTGCLAISGSQEAFRKGGLLSSSPGAAPTSWVRWLLERAVRLLGGELASGHLEAFFGDLHESCPPLSCTKAS